MTSAAAEAPAFPRLAGDGVADVGLLLEGTYPYVSGGVSTWVHEIITGFPDLTFGICFLGATPETYGDVKYRLPANVVHVEIHHLMATRPPARPRRHRPIDVQHQLGALARLHESMRAGTAPPVEVVDALASLDGEDGLSLYDFLHDDRVFAALCAEYDAHQPETSFIDYFWTLRTMHVPLFKLASIARSLPRFRALHAVSTGYAGALGALVRRRTEAPFILTEHGIYTKERTIDLAHAAWIKDEPARGEPRSAFGSLRQLWIQFFEALGRMAYAAADPIISLYDGNRARQIADGAAPARTRVIPNGIDLERFAGARRNDLRDPPRVVGLIGRIVPIKDIKTCVRAMQEVVAVLPDAEAWIVGPEDEDNRYAAECRALAAALGLDGAVRFLGYRQAEEVLPQLGVAVLTSISEALPLFVLEAFAAGVPVVATDVGCCRELIEGKPGDGDAAGAAGVVTAIASPQETARAVVSMLRDPGAWAAARQAATTRVHARYGRERMLDAYRDIYQNALEENGRHRLRAS